MSTLGSLIRYVYNKKHKPRHKPPRKEWEAKLRSEGKWIDYKRILNRCFKAANIYNDVELKDTCRIGRCNRVLINGF